MWVMKKAVPHSCGNPTPNQRLPLKLRDILNRAKVLIKMGCCRTSKYCLFCYSDHENYKSFTIRIPKVSVFSLLQRKDDGSGVLMASFKT